jgi:hypothetical protein
MKPFAAVLVTLALVLTGCGGGVGGGTTKAEADNGRPACKDSWVVGRTLPKDYVGCNRADDSVADAVFYQCKDGGKLANSADSDSLPGGAGSYFALFGGMIKKGDVSSKAYNDALTKCTA